MGVEWTWSQIETHGWEWTSCITSSCVSRSHFSSTPLLLSPLTHTDATLFPSDLCFLSSPAPPKRPLITSATSALPELPSGTPLPTSLASASLPSLFLFSDPLLRLLTSALSPLFDLTDQFSRIHSLIHHRCFNYSISTLLSSFFYFTLALFYFFFFFFFCRFASFTLPMYCSLSMLTWTHFPIQTQPACFFKYFILFNWSTITINIHWSLYLSH